MEAIDSANTREEQYRGIFKAAIQDPDKRSLAIAVLTTVEGTERNASFGNHSLSCLAAELIKDLSR
jgi:hypothetical protein